MPYGYLLALDLVDCCAEVCNDMGKVYDFLCECVEVLGMSTQGAPHVIRTDHQRYPEQEGLSAWVPLVDSSLVVHTVARQQFISVDIYSCRSFDVDAIAGFCIDQLGGRVAQKKLIERGPGLGDSG